LGGVVGLGLFICMVVWVGCVMETASRRREIGGYQASGAVEKTVLIKEKPEANGGTFKSSLQQGSGHWENKKGSITLDGSRGGITNKGDHEARRRLAEGF